MLVYYSSKNVAIESSLIVSNLSWNLQSSESMLLSVSIHSRCHSRSYKCGAQKLQLIVDSKYLIQSQSTLNCITISEPTNSNCNFNMNLDNRTGTLWWSMMITTTSDIRLNWTGRIVCWLIDLIDGEWMCFLNDHRWLHHSYFSSIHPEMYFTFNT